MIDAGRRRRIALAWGAAGLVALLLLWAPVLDAAWAWRVGPLPPWADPAAPRDPDPSRRDDALSCAARFCPRSRPDLGAPVLPVTPDRLIAIVAAMAAEEPGASLVAGPGEAGFRAPETAPFGTAGARYLVRSRWLRVPVLVEIAAIGIGPERTIPIVRSRQLAGPPDPERLTRLLHRWLERTIVTAGEVLRGERILPAPGGVPTQAAASVSPK